MGFADNFLPGVDPPAETPSDAWWFVFRGYRLLVQDDGSPRQLPLKQPPATLGIDVTRQQYLGRLNGQHCFSAEVVEACQAPPGYDFHGLRRLYGALPEPLFWVAGAAVQIVDWDRTHQFCGRCGAATQDKQYERAKECPRCGLVHYPRISPAVIVLVERGDHLLLARSKRHPPGLFSVLAGFVEPGETLEAAIRREIREEVGIEVADITYFGSQPWPFPNSLMIAFTCRHLSGEIRIDEAEMAEAAWYRWDDLPRIPPKLSIARQLIDWFLDKHGHF
ncbi:MAG: NAD(+) diphosphatase [Candidatus Promineifilaceae bacterium]|nr:NAD(+) diphosphatase [Candidatus Promineifilaceae bacterium]